MLDDVRAHLGTHLSSDGPRVSPPLHHLVVIHSGTSWARAAARKATDGYRRALPGASTTTVWGPGPLSPVKLVAHLREQHWRTDPRTGGGMPLHLVGRGADAGFLAEIAYLVNADRGRVPSSPFVASVGATDLDVTGAYALNSDLHGQLGVHTPAVGSIYTGGEVPSGLAHLTPAMLAEYVTYAEAMHPARLAREIGIPFGFPQAVFRVDWQRVGAMYRMGRIPIGTAATEQLSIAAPAGDPHLFVPPEAMAGLVDPGDVDFAGMLDVMRDAQLCTQVTGANLGVVNGVDFRTGRPLDRRAVRDVVSMIAAGSGTPVMDRATLGAQAKAAERQARAERPRRWTSPEDRARYDRFARGPRR